MKSVTKSPAKKSAAVVIAFGLGAGFFFYCMSLLAGYFFFISYGDLSQIQNARWNTTWYVLAHYPNKGRAIYSLLAALGLLSTLLIVGLMIVFADAKKPQHGDARFANTKEIRKMGLFSKTGLIVGVYNGKFLRVAGNIFLAMFAPTRSGKGVSFVVPNLLTIEESSIVQDIKGENKALTEKFRKEILGHEVFGFNLYKLNTHRWNPLDYVSKNPQHMAGDLNDVAFILYPDDAKQSDGGIWVNSARKLFIGVTMLILQSPHLPHTLGEVRRQLLGNGLGLDDNLKRVLEGVRTYGIEPSLECMLILNEFLAMDAKPTKNSILTNTTAGLSPWIDQAVDYATSYSDFSFLDLRKKKMTVYVNIPPHKVDASRVIANLFFAQAIGVNLKQGLPENDTSLKHAFYLFMDEFTAVGAIESLKKNIGFMLGYGIRMALIAQDKSQIIKTYQEDSKNFFANMHVSMLFTPHELDSAKEYSEVLGYQTIYKQTSRQKQSFGKSLSSTYSDIKRPLMLTQELLEMDRKKVILKLPGQKPVFADKASWLQIPELRDKMFSVGTRQIVVDGEERTVPQLLPLPPYKKLFHEHQMAASSFYVGKRD